MATMKATLAGALQIMRFSILDRYILRELLSPFFATLLLLTSLFVSVVAWKSLGEILVRELPLLFILNYFFDFMIQRLPELLPATSLLVGALTAGRLSGDLEITAMRAAGVSFSRIYFNFFRMGCLVMLAILLLNLYVVPLRVRSRENLLRSLNLHQGISFIQPGSFIQVPPYPQAGKGFSFYAKEADPGILEHLYMQHFDTLNDRRHITRITSAEKGLLLRRPAERHLRQDSGQSGEQGGGQDGRQSDGEAGGQGSGPYRASERPQRLDVSFGVLRGSPLGPSSYTRFLRLKNGFLFEADPTGGGYTITDFREGFMDYLIQSTPNPTNYIYGRPRIFTSAELLDLLAGMEHGGLTISLHKIYGPYQPRRHLPGEDLAGMEQLKQMIHREGYQIELPTLSAYRSIQQADREELSRMSPEEILQETGFYVPPEFNSPQKRRYLIDLGMRMFPDMEQMYRRCSLGLHRRVAVGINCLLLMLVSLPLGLASRRAGRGVSFGAALLLFLTYNSASYTLGRQVEFANLHYLAGAWLPSLLLIGVILWLMLRRTDGFSLWRITFGRHSSRDRL